MPYLRSKESISSTSAWMSASSSRALISQEQFTSHWNRLEGLLSILRKGRFGRDGARVGLARPRRTTEECRHLAGILFGHGVIAEGAVAWSCPTRTLDQVIVQLRKKLGDNGDDPKHLLTVHIVGYKLLL